MDQDELTIRLANLNEFARLEAKEKEELLDEMDETTQFLKSFVLRTCKENNKEVPKIVENLRVHQMATLAISMFQVMLTEQRAKIYEYDQLKKEIEDLQRENKGLLDDNQKLRSRLLSSPVPTEKVQSVTQVMEKTTDTPGPVVETLSPSSPVSPVSKTSPEETHAQKGNSVSPLLEMISQSKDMRLDDLIEHCSTKLSLSVKDAREQIEKLASDGMLEIFTSPMKPIQGYTYPALFRLTLSGMSAARTKEL